MLGGQALIGTLLSGVTTSKVCIYKDAMYPHSEALNLESPP